MDKQGNWATLPNRRDYDTIDGGNSRRQVIYVLSAATVMTAILLSIPLLHTSTTFHDDLPLLQKSHSSLEKVKIDLPTPASRCEWVQAAFAKRDGLDPNATELRDMYAAQSKDFNIFYRATAHIFWFDFVGAWGAYSTAVFKDLEMVHAKQHMPLSDKSTWTWVTGDQHLSNFGAWRNRHKDVVFGVNDFDEAAMFDFHVDVLRIAVSICNHALANHFNHDKDTHKILKTFTSSYIETVVGYVGNENAMLFELTPETTFGKLRKQLKKMAKKNSVSKQLDKFTTIAKNATERSFLKGTDDEAHHKTRLARVAPDLEAKIRAAFTSTHYGATMMKLSWNVREWDDDFFRVLDVAQRVGSGVGSFGVSRYYVLLQGADSLLDEDDQEGHAIILDVKFEPIGAVERVLTENDRAWYDNLFQNPADRVAQGQRKLTSYTDPFTGWVTIDNQVFGVRQRSPWKDSIELDKLLDVDDFEDFVAQIAIATATSHVRGSPAKPPADFKNVIHSIMKSTVNRREWGQGVENFARAYHEQVLLDYECFANFVEEKYGNTTDDK